MDKEKLVSFIRESNMIEGEVDAYGVGLFYNAHYEAFSNMFERGITTPDDIKAIHADFCGSLTDPVVFSKWKEQYGEKQTMTLKEFSTKYQGKWRKHNVRVGMYVPPDWMEVGNQMNQYMKDFPNMDSYTAHCEYEKIHPFMDFNGRVGRAIWLFKFEERYGVVPKSFLHRFYYESLHAYETKNSL